MTTAPAALDLHKELFTLAEVAFLLSLSERTVETLVAHGHLRSAIAPGTDRSRRVSRAMIEEYVETFNSQNPPICHRKRNGNTSGQPRRTRLRP